MPKTHRRLWIVEKPLWLFGRFTKRMWHLIRWIWGAILRFLNRDAVSLAILGGYAVTVSVTVSTWPPSRDWLGLHRPLDTVLVGVAALWGLMFLVWLHERIQEQALRFLPALLSSPFWLPLLLALFSLGFAAALVLLAVSLCLTPIAGLAVVLGVLYSWWRSRHGITLRCTRGECYANRRHFRDLEVRYLCPKCGTPYPLLIPNHFGFVYHECTCGGRIPALRSWRNRIIQDGKPLEQALRRQCPHGHDWGIGSDPLFTHFVAVVGGTSAGKTCYMTMVVQEFLRSASFESTEDQTRHEDNFRFLQQGRRLRPTQVGVPQATVLRLRPTPAAGGREARLYLYDAAGEECSRVERKPEEEFAFFHDLNSIILVIDPLGLPKLKDRLPQARELDWEEAGISPTPLEDVIAGLKRNIRRFLRYSQAGRSTLPLAVVISKCDAPFVRESVGTQAIQAAGGDAHEDELCRKALVAWGAEDQVLTLAQEFPTVRFFSCSPLGRVPDPGSRVPFIGERVRPPLQWLLETQAAPRSSFALNE